MGGTSSQTLKEMFKDPATVASLLAVTLPNVYDDSGRRVLAPGLLLNRFAEQYDRTNLERIAGDFMEQIRQRMASAETPPWQQYANLVSQDPEVGLRAGTEGQLGYQGVPSTTQKPSLVEQAQYKPELPTFMGLMTNMTPEQRRVVARYTMTRGPQAVGIEGLFDRARQDILGQGGLEAQRKDQLESVAVQRYLQDPFDTDAENALKVLKADTQRLDSTIKRRNDIALAKKFLGEQGPGDRVVTDAEALQVIGADPGFLSRQLQLRESVMRQRGMLQALENTPGVDEEDRKTAKHLANVGAFTNDIFNIMFTRAGEARFLLDIGKVYRSVVSAWGNNQAVDPMILQRVIDEFPQYRDKIIGINSKALELQQQQVYRDANLKLATDDFRQKAEQFKLSHGLSLQNSVREDIRALMYEEVQITSQISQLSTDVASDQAKTEIRKLSQRLTMNRAAQQQLWVNLNILKNPVLQTYLEEFDATTKINEVMASNLPPTSKIAKLNDIQRGLNTVFDRYLHKLPNGQQAYKAITDAIQTKREEIISGVTAVPQSQRDMQEVPGMKAPDPRVVPVPPGFSGSKPNPKTLEAIEKITRPPQLRPVIPETEYVR